MTSTETPPVDNGVNIEALLGARQHLTDAPELAKFQWRATSEWVKGTHNRTTFTDFSGLTQEHTHRQTYTIDSDHPEIFASEDNGVTPVEVALAALASCLTGGVATVASNRNIQLHSVTATIQGTMDIQGMLGIDDDVRNGFSGIHVAFTIDADASEAEIEALVAQSQKRSPVFDIISNPTAVTVGLA